MRKIACLTIDVESDFLDTSGHVLLLQDEALFQRYVSILRSRGVKLTAFLVTSLLEQHGEALRRLQAELPVEFAIHSHAHDMSVPCSPEDILLAERTYREFMGSAPSGYRAPIGQITRDGLETLMDLGLRYDSSIFPSVRPAMPWGYNNLHLPVHPFRICWGSRSIIEVPMASLSVLRLNFSLSYVKLFGWETYRLLIKLFPLPGQLAVLSHPYDHYFHLVQDRVSVLEKPLLQRNAPRAFDLLERMLDHLAAAGYEFELMSGLCDTLDGQALPEYPLESIVNPRFTRPPVVRSELSAGKGL